MKLTPKSILIPMMDGNTVAKDVMAFEHSGLCLAVRKINDGMSYILHAPTGLKITAEHTGDPQEAADGFADAVAAGAYDLSGVEAAAAASPTINQ